MDTQIKASLVMIEKKLEALEERIEVIADEVSELKEDLPTNLDEDLSEIKSLLIQMA
jgi:archaellum component FlaC